jgi:FAD/FMN-containing dehydrogenase
MDWTALRESIAGSVVTVDDDGYEAMRGSMLWNQLRPDRQPAAIIGVASEADVITAVRFAGERGQKVAIRGGGHSWCGMPLRDGGLLLDLARLDQVSIDPAARTAAVQPAVTGRNLSRHLARHGLAFPVGHCSSVALGGYLLSGGFGWNSGAWGPACLNVRAIEVVTADAKLVRASESEHADLFWAARGAGAGFCGVATRFHLGLHPLPQAVATSTYVYPLARLPELASWLPGLASRLARNVELTTLLTAAPPGGSARAGAGRACVVITATAFVDDAQRAAEALAPLEECPVLPAALIVERPQPTPFEALFDMMDGHFPAQHRYVADTVWSNEPAARVLTAVQGLLARAPSPRSRLLCVLPPPAPPEAAAPDVALSMTGGVLVACYAVWDKPAGDAVNRAWHRDVMTALEPLAIGHYLGESDIAAAPSRARRSFAPAHWQRLQALRRQYDPDGVFHSWFEGAGS